MAIIGNQQVKIQNASITLQYGTMFYRFSTIPVPETRPVIILVHGLVVPSRVLLPLAERLAPFFRVYAPDLPGFGKSEKPSHVLTLSEIADVLKEWMEALGIKQAAFIGASFGCQVVVQFVLRHPEFIQRAVLIGPTLDPEARSISKQLPRWMAVMSRRPLAFPSLIFDYAKAGLVRSFRTLSYAIHDPVERHLPSVHIPTLVLRGSRDTITPQRWAEQVARLLPESRLTVIKDASHDLQDDAPEELTAEIVAFLQQ